MFVLYIGIVRSKILVGLDFDESQPKFALVHFFVKIVNEKHR
jgi:hypothetical protein